MSEKPQQPSKNGPSSIITIDEHALDKECVRLPGDYLKYALQAADARRNLDEMRAELEVKRASLSRKIRETPADYGIEKVTESAIESAITLNDYVKAIEARIIECKHEQEKLQAVVASLEMKKRSLTLMVDLLGMSYFSHPKISEGGQKAVERMRQEGSRRRKED